MPGLLAGARLYTHSRNSAGERVRIALQLKGLEVEMVDAPELPRAEWKELNPQGLMPALRLADGRVIAQATAILELLEECAPAPPLLPADPVGRAQARAFAQHIASDLHPITVQRVRRHLAAPDDGTAWVAHWTSLAMTALEAALDHRHEATAFCFSDQPGWADLHLVPQLRASRRLGCDLSPYPGLLAVEARCDTHPAFRLPAPEFGV